MSVVIGDKISMKLFIPELGTKIRLTQPWTFTLEVEYRNISLYEAMKGAPIDTPNDNRYEWNKAWSHTADKPMTVTIPEGVILQVDRIYVKRPSDYNSVTFRIPKKCGNPQRLEGCRFWAKLNDVNNIEGDIL